ncbi:calmodulin-like [Centruroides vittatus]|uniref:calmodulin-like n=1 Tax=Centruroides vittatus TaxID=120091 RepID=UPI00350FA51E
MENKLNDKQISQYLEAFHHFDRDKTGTVNIADLGPLMRSLGFNFTDIEKDVDIVGFKIINFPGFLNIMARRIRETDNKQKIIEAFRLFDKEESGYVSSFKLYNIMTTLGEKLSSEEAKEMIRVAGVNEDGQINYEKFVDKMIKK